MNARAGWYVVQALPPGQGPTGPYRVRTGRVTVRAQAEHCEIDTGTARGALMLRYGVPEYLESREARAYTIAPVRRALAAVGLALVRVEEPNNG